jgi:hypothetical protein
VAVLRAEPLSWGSPSLRILAGDEEVARLITSVFKGNGKFEVDGESFTVDSHGILRQKADLKKGSSVIAKVRKKGFFGRTFEISSAGHHLVLEGQGLMGKTYVLRLANQEVGWIKREGFSGRSMTLEFPDEVPAFLQMLILYVVVVQARMEGAAAAAGG